MSPFESLRGIKNKPEYQALETQRLSAATTLTRFNSPNTRSFPSTTLMLDACGRWRP